MISSLLHVLMNATVNASEYASKAAQLSAVSLVTSGAYAMLEGIELDVAEQADSALAQLLNGRN